MEKKGKRNEGQSTGKDGERVAWRGYINYTPTQSDKQTLRELLGQGEDPTTGLSEALSSGFRVTLTYDSYHSAFSAQLYDTKPGRSTSGFCLVQRGGDPITALVRLFFVHNYILRGNWERLLSGRSTQDEWE